jgi:hypothetical protein
VRDAAVWALKQLLPDDEFASLSATHCVHEPEETIRAQWQI